MNIVSKTINTSLKSALLATSLLGIVLLGLNNGDFLEVFAFFPIVIIVTLIFSSIGISSTILPFYYLGKKDSLTVLFKKYFPFYAIIGFTVCLIFTFMAGFMGALVVFGIAYITAMFAWVWFFKPEQK